VLQQLANTASKRLSLNLVTVLPAKSSAICQKIKSELGPHVNMQSCIYREEFSEPASSYIIKSQSTGSRTIVNYNELPDMTVDEFIDSASKLAPATAWFHFEVCFRREIHLVLLLQNRKSHIDIVIGF
jgi:ketohexokinase